MNENEHDRDRAQDSAQTKRERLEEIRRLRQRITELEKRVADPEQILETPLEQKDLFRALIKQAYDGIAVIQDARLVYVNPRMAEIVGYTVEALLNTPFDRYIYPSEAEKITERYALRMAGKKISPRYEMALAHKNGRRIEVEFNTGIISYRGRPADFIFIRDITEQKETERKLRASEARYRNIVESAPQGIITIDWKGTITSCNTTFSKLTGFSKDEVVGKHFSKMGTMRLQDRPRWTRIFKSLIHSSSKDGERCEAIEVSSQ
ncbi:MAG TPA: PAS domain S-box protein [Chloroflexi bacterium]|nr:PAS domain S-box protein [Chloroflexota bacterium]